MTQEEKNILAYVKDCLDEARDRIDVVRFGSATDEEHEKLTAIHGLLCEATDKLYDV